MLIRFSSIFPFKHRRFYLVINWWVWFILSIWLCKGWARYMHIFNWL